MDFDLTLHYTGNKAGNSLADPRGTPGMHPPGGPNSVIFMQFVAKN